MEYNFDEIIDRRGTDCVKYDDLYRNFGCTDILPLWVADMDFKVATPIVDAAMDCCRRGVFGYTFRSDEAKQAFIEWVDKRYHWRPQLSWMSTSPGIVTALSVSVRAFTAEEDKVLILTPVYPPFHAVVTENRRKLLRSTLIVRQGRYEVDWEDFEHKLKQGVKLFIISNPHNPVGRVWTKEELKHMGDLCCKYNVMILSDEIHSDLALFGHRHTVMASVSPEIAARTLTAMAPSKTFNIAGMMNSLIIASSESVLECYNREMLALHLEVGNIFGHITLAAAYRHGAGWLSALIPYLERNVDYVAECIHDSLPFVQMIKPEGSFLLWLDFRGTGLKHEEIKDILVHKAKVGLNDGLAFGEEGYGFMRMNIGCPRSVLEEGLLRIQKAF